MRLDREHLLPSRVIWTAEMENVSGILFIESEPSFDGGGSRVCLGSRID